MKKLIFLLATCAFSCASFADQFLTIGDSAPSFKPAAWLKGTPVKSFEKGKVYVVEFWATWCHPCVDNIPHLTELAKKYKGKATIIGCDVWENNQPIEKVKAFVKKQGSKMDYNVAADGSSNEIAKSWLTAASEGGIPCSFIINQEGKVAWIGHPASMETALTQVIEGKFDVSAARTARENDKTIVRPITEAIESKDYAKTVQLIDAAIAKDAKNRYRFMYQLLTCLFYTDADRGKKLSREVIEEAQKSIGVYNMVAAIFATESGYSKESYAFGLSIVDEGLGLNQQLPLFKGMKAAILFNSGDKEGAVKLCEEALALAEGDSHVSPQFKQTLQKNLEKFKSK